MFINKQTGLPNKIGLYDPILEKDACGVGFVVSIEGVSSNKVLKDARTMLVRMAHRGACGCDNNTGDGAGVLTSIPHGFFSSILKREQNIELPEHGKYAVVALFTDKEFAESVQNELDLTTAEYNLKVVLSFFNLTF
jgi:glutamate synthase (NADH)